MSLALPVIVIGAGGHARVLADTLLRSGRPVLGFTDAKAALRGTALLGLPILGSDEVLESYSPREVELVNGIGSIDNRRPSVREQVQETLRAQGWRFARVIHPSATLSSYATLGDGVQIMAGSVVQCGAVLGDGVIINTGSIVEHDVCVGDWSHIAPGAVVCGDVSIGRFCHIGAGVTVRQGLSIGDGSLVGLGAAVVRSTGTSSVLLGVPARPFNSL
ncbi:acetyltransferase [Pelomonas sp. P7]|uniref:Acetyltransferase n=1 Tax=Pelomonas caseinilytica TaxID=2906763 RepID=A0ABS8XFB9_9BURK|nr:acetyltransferase [Pelomonas sp. P7]MCE4538177.1 acetyltransferase [Pelomonas sp. P7]